MGKEDEDDNFKPNGTILKRTVQIVGGKTEFINYEIGQNLRKGGGGGTCYLCRDAQTKEIFVVKEFPIDYLPEKERNLHQSLDHKNIVKIKDNFIENKKLYLLLEYCQNSDLSSLLKKRIKLKEIEVQYYIINLIEAVKYLHEKRIAHRDIKPSNIFLTDKLEVKLGDFGLSKEVSENEIMRDEYGTHGYMAPEIYENKGYLFEVDIWAIGVIIYQLILGKLPFYGNDNKDTKSKIMKVEFIFPENAIISKAAKDLIKQILVKDPKKRPSLDQILVHDFFKLGRSIPKLLPISFKDKEPSISYIKNFMLDADDNGIVNRDVKTTNLKIINAKDDIICDTKHKEERNDIYITDCLNNAHYKKYYGFAYHLSNNNTGVYFKDSTKIIYNPQTNLFFYILYRNKQKEVKSYYKDDNNSYNKDLVKKVGLLDTALKKFRENNKIKSENIKNEEDEKKKKYKNIESEKDLGKTPLYVKYYYFYGNSVYLILSNNDHQVYFLNGQSTVLLSNNDIIFYEKIKNKNEFISEVYNSQETDKIDVEKKAKIKIALRLNEKILSKKNK